MGVRWSDEVDAIMGGDAAAMFAYLTPAKGVVMWPMAPLGIRDREAGTVTVTTARGLWKKLERLKANPGAALAYHAREHGHASGEDFVLVQGRAQVQEEPDREWLESITPQWERFLGPRTTGLTAKLMGPYYWDRVAITIHVERVSRWRDARCEGEPEVDGEPWPASNPPQNRPRNGTRPRVDVEELIEGARDLPHTILGWCGGDGLPTMVAAEAKGVTQAGAQLVVPASILPKGGRRAGLTSHAFHRAMVGQEQRVYTGWLDSDGSGVITYSPHTRAGNKLPPSKALFSVGAGVAVRLGQREARQRGLA
ncbi:hypothetical protein HJD18_09795 [Thermoleophilia bacterium SCSIO 60948]|nr:hypothetical protein HJD18_09795 [Thermoleophilia bacterium SCSIO 60948]